MASANSWSEGRKASDVQQLEKLLRPMLLLNDVIAMSLSFASQRASFLALGIVLSILIIFNSIALLVVLRGRRMKLPINVDGVVSPSLAVTAIDGVAAVALVILYVLATIEACSHRYYWEDRTVMKTYASIGALIALILHGALAAAGVRQFIRYRNSLGSRCPHCHQELRSPHEDQVEVPSPSYEPPSATLLEETGAAVPRESFSANSVGEAEGDRLITKS